MKNPKKNFFKSGEQMKKLNMRQAAEKIKTLLCVILFVCMLVQVLVYFAYTKEMSSAVNDDLQSLLVLKSGELAGSGTNDYSRYLRPAFVGIRHMDVQRGLSSGSEAVAAICELIDPLIVLLTGKNYYCKIVQEDAAQVWDSCFDHENYIYVRYHGDLLLQTLCYFAVSDQATDFSQLCNGDNALVRELMILPSMTAGGSFTVTAYLRDSTGTVAHLAPADQDREYYVSMGEIFAMIFNNSYFYDFSFQRDAQCDYGNLILSDFTVYSDVHTALYPLQQVRPDSEYFRDADISSSILRLFSFNPDKLYSYTEQDGTVTCVESFGVFRAEQNGKMEFNALGTQEGISLSAYLNYSDYDNSYDIYEFMTGSNALVDSLCSISSDLFGGNADVCLYEICRSGENLVFNYIYTYDNIPILDADGQLAKAFTVTYHDGAIVSFVANCIHYSPSTTQIENYAQDWICQKYAESLQEPLHAEVMLAYVPLPNEESRLLSDWIFHPIDTESTDITLSKREQL